MVVSFSRRKKSLLMAIGVARPGWARSSYLFRLLLVHLVGFLGVSGKGGRLAPHGLDAVLLHIKLLALRVGSLAAGLLMFGQALLGKFSPADAAWRKVERRCGAGISKGLWRQLGHAAADRR